MAIQSGQQSNQATEQQRPAGQKPTSTRGFAAMDAEKHKKVSSQGGRASQQTQHTTRQTQQDKRAQSPMTENFSQQNKQESSTESAASIRNVSNQSTGLSSTSDDFKNKN
ncbi:MAG: hypothetical protein H7Z71_11725 [Moraxellaceae bacterium]|nr:hypothetical protein [Pseudobdellovibrionaceae bacterium]